MTIKKIANSDLNLIKDKLLPVLSFYKNKKVFITGGTGFFGKWILEAIIYLNQSQGLDIKVTILTRDSKIFIEKNPHLGKSPYVRFVIGDIKSFPIWDEQIDYIIHAATDVAKGINGDNSEDFRRSIIDGTNRVIQFANATGCKRVLYTSSGAAYGNLPSELSSGVLETCTPITDQSDVYSDAKLQSELQLKEKLECDLVIARCFAFSGPYLPLDSSYAFGNFIKDKLNNRKIVIQGNGQSVRSYLYAADLVIWLLTILVRGKNRETYNVGSNVPITIRELAELIYGSSDGVIVKSPLDTSDSIYYPSIDKVKLELGLDVYTSLNDAVLNTLNFELGK